MKISLVGRALKEKTLYLWFFWVFSFYVAWTVLVIEQQLLATVLENWEIAFAMLIGSFAAGSTPMGGGSVGFPVLVMIMEMPAELGRDFSFSIQAIGMTSASILIFCRKQAVDYRVLYGATCGALIGTPLGIYVVSNFVDGLFIKLIFSTLWAGFGILHVVRFKEISSHHVNATTVNTFKWRAGFVAAALSTSTVCGVTGVGVDMIIYCVLILLFRRDLKIAIPTSVIIMAFTSVIGVAIKLNGSGIEDGVFELWLAAAPVVILGAPLGVLVVDLVGRNKTLFAVAVLCIGQYVWVCIREFSHIGTSGLALSLLAVCVVIFLLEILRRKGLQLANQKIDERDEFVAVKADANYLR